LKNRENPLPWPQILVKLLEHLTPDPFVYIMRIDLFSRPIMRFSSSAIPKIASVAVCCVLMNGCTSFRVPTPGEQARNDNSFGYKPIDPIPIKVSPFNSSASNILQILPDETMRLAIGTKQGSVGVTYGPANIGYAGSNYLVTLDYIKYTTMPLGLMKTPSAVGTKIAEVYSLATNNQSPDVIVPAYVGVGVRLEANISVNQGSVNLGSLTAIGVAAQAGNISGTLLVQSLGMSGQAVSSAITIASDINPTTIQNALVAMGTIKSKVYDAGSSITIMPRVVGIYDDIGGGASTMNGIIASLLEKPLVLDTGTGLVGFAPAGGESASNATHGSQRAHSLASESP
jgi:hypothetical protein